MRKDVKLVVAAACLLLVGLLGYVLFAPTHKAADVAVDDTGKSGADTTSAGGPSAVDTTADNTQAVTPQAPPLEVTLAPTTQPTTPAVSIALNDTQSPTTAPSAGTAIETASTPAAGPTDWQTTLNTGSVATATGSASNTTTSAGGIPANTLIGYTQQPNTSTGSTGALTGTTGGTQTGTNTATPAGSKTHKVAYGETLSSIATDYYGNKATYAKIMAANPTVNPNKLKVGTVLVIPALPSDSDATTASGTKSPAAGATGATSGNTYTVKSGDSLQKIAQSQFGSSDKWQKIYELNRSQIGGDPHRLKVGMTLKLPEKQ